MTEKRVSPGKIILLIVVVLFLLLIGFAGYVYIRSSRQIVENDDVKDLLQQEPMDIAGRYVVDEEGNLVCRLDKSDLYYYLEKSYGSGAADEMIADLEKETGLDVEAFTVDLEEPSFSLAARYNKLRFAADLIPELTVDNGNVRISLSGIRVAGITVPARWIKALNDVSFDVTIDPPFLKEVKGVSFEDGMLCLHGPLDTAFLDAVDPDQGYDKPLTYYINDYREILDAGAVLSKDASKASEIFLDGVKEKGFRTVIEDYFHVAYPARSRELMTHRDLSQRFLTEYMNVEFLNLFHPVAVYANESAHNIELLTDRVYRALPTNMVTIKEGQFYYHEDPFTYDDFLFLGWDEVYDKLLDPDTFRLVLIDDEQAFKGNTAKISKYVDDLSSIKDPADPDKVYTLGFVFKTRTGQPLLAYNILAKGIIGFDAGLFEISEELFEKLSDPSVIHIYQPE